MIADRAGRRSQVVYDGGCSAPAALRHRRGAARPAPTPCSTPWPTAVTPTSPSATLQIRPAGSSRRCRSRRGVPPPYALAGPEAVWYAAGRVRARPPDIKAPARTLVAAPTGGTVRAVVRREPVTAWLARNAAGQDGVYEQIDGGRPATLYRETRPGVHLTSLALLDGGRVAVVALRSASDVAHGERAARDARVSPSRSCSSTSAPSPPALAYNPVVSAFGQQRRLPAARRLRARADRSDRRARRPARHDPRRHERAVAQRRGSPIPRSASGAWSGARPQIAGARLVRSRVLATPA